MIFFFFRIWPGTVAPCFVWSHSWVWQAYHVKYISSHEELISQVKSQDHPQGLLFPPIVICFGRSPWLIILWRQNKSTYRATPLSTISTAHTHNHLYACFLSCLFADASVINVLHRQFISQITANYRPYITRQCRKINRGGKRKSNKFVLCKLKLKELFFNLIMSF